MPVFEKCNPDICLHGNTDYLDVKGTSLERDQTPHTNN